MFEDIDFSSEEDLPIIDLETTLLTSEDASKLILGQANVILPQPNARPCNNLDEYFARSTINTQKNAKNNQRQTQFKVPFAVPLVRRFDRILKKNPSGPSTSANANTIPSTSDEPMVKKRKPDIFSKIDQLEENSGPLHLLKKLKDKQVKVLIRRRRNVPYISRVIEYRGHLVMFDKHTNLCLQDVVESFKYSVDGKIFKRARHRESLLVRGDNIILIS